MIDEEIEKLSVLEVQSAEYAVSRNYLDWLTIVPWGVFSEENHNLNKAENKNPSPKRTPGIKPKRKQNADHNQKQKSQHRKSKLESKMQSGKQNP